jgi:S1-C subfamily serine protease
LISRRRLAAALCGAAAFPIQAVANGDHGLNLTTEVRRLVQAGELALTSGDVEAARNAFDQASQLVHAPEVELGLVRTYMQAGEYRRALAFAAHAAGAHTELPAGTALYAWLLQVGGQGRVATSTLSAALQRAPADATLQQAKASLSDPWPTVAGVLTELPWRTAPYAWGAAVPATAHMAGSGIVIDQGRAVLVPTHLLGAARDVWVRNGLGQTAQAVFDQQLETTGLTQLRLLHPLAPPAMLRAVREPFGGSPGYTVEFAPGPGTLAAWPLLRAGFFGRSARDGTLRPLGIDVPPGPLGGPVFDAAGRLVGIATWDIAGGSRLVPVQGLTVRTGEGEPDAPASGRLPTKSIDEIYERALTATAQVILTA